MLVDAVKRKLRITYEDADVNARVDDIMAQADAALRRTLGIDDEAFTFETPGTEQFLYLAFCFYEWNDAGDDFGANYAEKIAQCRDKWLVKKFAENEEGTADV